MQLQLGPINPPFWQTKLVLHLPVNQKKIANLLTSLQMQYNAITHYVIWSVLSIYMYQVLADNSCDKHRLKFTDFSTHNCYPVNHKWHSTYQMLQTLLCINHIFCPMWTQKECSVRNTLCVIKFLSSCLLVIYTGKVLTVTHIGLVCQFDVQKTRPVSLSHPGLHKRITCYYGFRLPVSRICLLHNGFWIIYAAIFL